MRCSGLVNRWHVVATALAGGGALLVPCGNSQACWWGWCHINTFQPLHHRAYMVILCLCIVQQPAWQREFGPAGDTRTLDYDVALA